MALLTQAALTTVVLLVMSNINLLLFYGLTGRALGFNRVIANTVDAALPFSIFNVVFFFVLWAGSVLPNHPRPAVAP